MNEDRMKGSLKQAKGSVKEATGKMTGNERLRREGQADQVAGKVQNAFGNLKDAIKDRTMH